MLYLEDSEEICWMVYKFSCPEKLCVNIPELNWWFMYNILDTAGSSFSSCMVFYVEEVSVVLYMDNPVTSSQLYVTFARLFVFKEYSVTNFKLRWYMVCCLLCVFEPILIQNLLSYSKCMEV